MTDRRRESPYEGESSATAAAVTGRAKKRPRESVFERQDPQQKKVIGLKYREMQERVDEMRSDLSNLAATDLTKQLKSQNEIFRNVKDTGIATLDARLMNQTAETAMALARKLKVDNASFDTDEFLSRIKLHLGPIRDDALDSSDDELEESDETDEARARRARARAAQRGAQGSWEKIGWMAAKYSKRVMGMEIMYGPLAVQHEKRKVAPRARRRSLPPEIQPTTVVAESSTVKDDVTAHVKRVLGVLRKNDRARRGINLFKLVVNPDSFGQTVENVFYTSFLIKEKRAAVRIEQDGEIFITWQELDEAEGQRTDLPTFQAVLELDMETWKEAKEIFNITESLIPNRRVEQAASLNPNKWY